MELIDVNHLGHDRVIGCWNLDGVLIDPGPSSSVNAVIDALGGEQPRALLLTHIHLDHAGATGTLVKRWPDLPVFVHERGAPHLIDPSKLMKSAGRLYGDEMDRLWGEVLPVSESNITALSGGEEVMGLRVAYTPGHASHHVSYFDPDSGRAFVGDTAGVRIPPGEFVIPPTPPPDIDLEAWNESLDTILAWGPTDLGLTHFGVIDDPAAHVELLRRRLGEQAERARTGDLESFTRGLREDADRELDPASAERLIQATPPDQQYLGLERYWRKKQEAEGEASAEASAGPGPTA